MRSWPESGSGARRLHAVLPEAAARRAAAERSGRLAWSALLPVWLRKHGFVFSEGAQAAAGAFNIAVRGAAVAAPSSAGLLEGPLAADTLKTLGLTARTIEAENVTLCPDEASLSDEDPERLVGLAYGRDVLRRIPAKRGERSDPYAWEPDDRRLAAGPVPVQIFQPADGWRVLAHARLDDRGPAQPAIVGNGRLVLLGLPLFDMAVRKHWMPPTEHGYYALQHDPFSVEAELWLARLIARAAAASGAPLPRLEPWPNGCRAALSIRFDHDRDIAMEDFRALLDLLDEHALKASWGFLARLAPGDKMAEAAARGHEIVLHTEAPDRQGLLRELATLRSQGWAMGGVTAHGGIGSAGHLGQAYFEWAADGGLSHADILSRHTHAPHPTIAVRDGEIGTGRVFLPPAHHSLDVGTAPDAHRLGELEAIVPARLKAGDHVTVMNHPDIHRVELRRLLSGLKLSDVWAATHGQAVEWAASLRYGWRWGSDGRLRFDAPLPADAAVRWTGAGEDGRRIHALAPDEPAPARLHPGGVR